MTSQPWVELLAHKLTSVVLVTVLQVGDRDDSNLYISAKMKAAAEVRSKFSVVVRALMWKGRGLSSARIPVLMLMLRPVFLRQIGIDAKHVRLPSSATQDEVSDGAAPGFCPGADL